MSIFLWQEDLFLFHKLNKLRCFKFCFIIRMRSLLEFFFYFFFPTLTLNSFCVWKQDTATMFLIQVLLALCAHSSALNSPLCITKDCNGLLAVASLSCSACNWWLINPIFSEWVFCHSLNVLLTYISHNVSVLKPIYWQSVHSLVILFLVCYSSKLL